MVILMAAEMHTPPAPGSPLSPEGVSGQTWGQEVVGLGLWCLLTQGE